MKTMLKGAVALALMSVVSFSTANAQGVRFGVAGTGLFSLETGGGSEFGGMALVGFGSPTSMIGFRVDATVLHKSGVTPIIGTGDITYTFKTAETSSIHPYLLAGGGIEHISVAGVSSTKPVAKVGAGFDYNLPNGKMAIFAEPTFNLLFLGSGAGTQKALQVNVGVKFGGK